MATQNYHCRKIVGGVAQGTAVVADTRVSFWGGFDPVTGKIVEVGSPLEGMSLENKVVVFRSTKGSSGSSRMLRLAKISRKSPVALINLELDELGVLSCVAQELPMVTDLECDPFESIRTGDWVKVDADRGVVEVTPQTPRPRPVSHGEDAVGRCPASTARICLTEEQQAMLGGAQGSLRAGYLRRLITWGEAFGARRLVPVESVMINGVSVPNRTLGIRDVKCMQTIEKHIPMPSPEGLRMKIEGLFLSLSPDAGNAWKSRDSDFRNQILNSKNEAFFLV